MDTLKTLLVDNITGLLNQIQNNEQETMDINKKKFEKLSEIYENRLISSLSSREISPQFENELCDIRLEFELQRFDYVAKLNQNNCQKKYILTKVIYNTFIYCYLYLYLCLYLCCLTRFLVKS